MKIPKILNQILGTTYSTCADISTNPNFPQIPTTSSSSRATRAINLLT